MNKSDHQDEAGNPAFEGYDMTRDPKRDVLELLKEAMDRSRPGTANSDVNVFAIEYPIPYFILDGLKKEIERLRSLAGAVTDGPSFAEIRDSLAKEKNDAAFSTPPGTIRRKPTIAELEAILKEPDTPVRVNPDGSVTAEPTPEQRARQGQ